MAADQTTSWISETGDLFVDLYSYRQRENKDPLEDWLTECLAVTIRALPKETKFALLAELSGLPPDAPMLPDTHEIEIATQYPAGAAGRPDVLVLLDGHPWILFENKVGHGIDLRTDEHGAEIHQLRRYADWLAKNGRDCPLRRAMVFVTHITRPPEDFCGRDVAGFYHGFSRHHTSWGALGRRLAELTEGLPDEFHTKALVKAFNAYLEEQDMSNEFPSSADFAAAELYVSRGSTLENLVSRMWDELATTANFSKTAGVQLKALTDEGSVCAWRYVAPGPSSPSRSSFLQTGIWFPEAELWFDVEDLGVELRGPHAYVFFGNDEDDLFSTTSEAPDGFLRPTSDFLTCKSIATFSADPQARGEGIIAWVAEQASALKSFLSHRGLIT